MTAFDKRFKNVGPFRKTLCILRFIMYGCKTLYFLFTISWIKDVKELKYELWFLNKVKES